MKHVRTFKIDRLFFRYIKDSYLEGKISTNELANKLEQLGLIQRLDNDRRYSEIGEVTRAKVLEKMQGEL